MARKSNRKNTGFPASSVTRPGSKGVSQALKQRRYIDIQLKDVLEEMARGNWTEEDDKLWKTTKPYECDECCERSSTRVCKMLTCPCTIFGMNTECLDPSTTTIGTS